MHPSVDNEGRIHISWQFTPTESAEVTCLLRGNNRSKVKGTILTDSEMNAHNTFDNPSQVKPKPFDGAVLEKEELRALLPPKSVVVLSVE